MANKKIRVAFIVGALPFGGIEVLLLSICKEIQKRNNIEARVFNLSGTGMLQKKFTEESIDIACIGKSKSAIKTFRLDTAFKLRSALNEFDPDIVHTQHFSADLFGRIAARLNGIPVLTHIRNTKTERHLHRRLINKGLSFITDGYIAISKMVERECVTPDHNLADRPIHLLHNAIDLKRLDSPAINLQQEFGLTGKTIVGLARLVPQKNFDLLIKAFAEVNTKYTETSLLIIGEGKERANLEHLIRELRLEDKAVLAGYRNDAPALLKSCSLFCAPSEYEGFCNAHLEAMAAGLPAVLSEHVPSIEISEDAALVCHTTPEDLADKIIQILADQNRYEKMQANALQTSRQHDIPAYVDKLIGIYSKTFSRQ